VNAADPSKKYRASIRSLAARQRERQANDARWLARFEDDHDGIRLRAFEVRVDKLIATVLSGVHDRVFCVSVQPINHF
jgi:hypothetical protein